MTGFNQGFSEHGVLINHHFGDDGSGVYIKETLIPPGRALSMHTHTFTHKSVLCVGVARVTADGVTQEITGPCVLVMHQGVQHKVESVTECAWLCIHATDETDPDLIDHTLVGQPGTH